MSALIEPGSVGELVEVIRSTPRLIALGAGTKPRLTEVDERFARVSLRQIKAIVEYEPDEYTITALAGTPLADLASALEAHGQYLPFDPVLTRAGSTLGGAVAAGASGPGRFKVGGVRDFILGVRLIDGAGRLLRLGGKVVKNAAGFDVPKFVVGSLGRFGVLSEITMKVFPRPAGRLTLRLEIENVDQAVRILTECGNSRWQPDALDIPPRGDALLVRLAAPPAALNPLAQDILARWPGRVLTAKEADCEWLLLSELQWTAAESILIKTNLTLADAGPVVTWVQQQRGARVHVCGGGNMGFISLPSLDHVNELDRLLSERKLAAATWRGPAPLWLGTRQTSAIGQAVKTAFDPDHRFPGIDD